MKPLKMREMIKMMIRRGKNGEEKVYLSLKRKKVDLKG